MVMHGVPNASNRTSRTGERDDRLVTSFLVDDMVLVASEQILRGRVFGNSRCSVTMEWRESSRSTSREVDEYEDDDCQEISEESQVK